MADSEANKQEYEVLQPVRVEDDTLVFPSSEEDEVTTVSLTDEDAKLALATDAVRPVRKAKSARSADPGENQVTGDLDPATDDDAPDTPVTPDPPVAGHDHAAPEDMDEVDVNDPAAADATEGSVETVDASGGTAEDSESLEGVFGEKLASHLRNGGYAEPNEVRQASDDELLALDGIGSTAVRQIRQKQ